MDKKRIVCQQRIMLFGELVGWITHFDDGTHETTFLNSQVSF